MSDTLLPTIDLTDEASVLLLPDAERTAGHGGHGLSDEQRRMLVFEREWWRYASSRDDAIRAHFEMKPQRYAARLDALIDDDRALAVDPMLVKRLRRLRAAKARSNGGRRLHGGASASR